MTVVSAWSGGRRSYPEPASGRHGPDRRPARQRVGGENPPTGIALEEVERIALIEALKMSNWVQKDAAELLANSTRVMNYKIKTLGIDFPRSSAASRAQRDLGIAAESTESDATEDTKDTEGWNSRFRETRPIKTSVISVCSVADQSHVLGDQVRFARGTSVADSRRDFQFRFRNSNSISAIASSSRNHPFSGIAAWTAHVLDRLRVIRPSANVANTERWTGGSLTELKPSHCPTCCLKPVCVTRYRHLFKDTSRLFRPDPD